MTKKLPRFRIKAEDESVDDEVYLQAGGTSGELRERDEVPQVEDCGLFALDGVSGHDLSDLFRQPRLPVGYLPIAGARGRRDVH